ncbi:single-stranded-DNA-specific exonuclease RecJ [Lutimonas zeaxanthinifaciens]|uniref:single-stranded-DNA-specific exonuclease RecJ n=1 Tax=Lutimonas zeaxanthinifaciens TaxID=3060215 RepID=UPI00265CAD09|nr:single-stranded-DNA-specific exonuclease RecJ [Lutimonas sp. YSD2104]WKK66108.1 single-stranded-DNA-specific exonuclease RecJ [Lutimonas sp. YSD2104]
MRWIEKIKPEKEKIELLSKSLGIDLVLSTILIQRGIESFDEAKDFFRPSLDQIHDPFLMKDMEKAVRRIEKAIRESEHIMIYGDYDVDGTTAVSLVYDYLHRSYKKISTYIPDRYNEGYGISYTGIDYAEDNEVSLIIALDCGIKAVDKIDYAMKKGIDFIICDHHRPGELIPNAIAVLDPKREDCQYPYTELCGCGIGFKLIQALEQNKGNQLDNLYSSLDLVATAIAADIVPLTGENRILAYFGLQVINNQPRPGIKALIHGVKKPLLNITDVVFIIAPRINAAGRMKHGSFAVELLTEKDFSAALEYAAEIDMYNSERKALDQSITEEALLQIRENNEENRFSTVVRKDTWHKGVIGIVASRLIEKYYRPTLVFTKSGTKLAASARSVKGYDVYAALNQCGDFIEQFGGHKYAAGLTLLPENYIGFKEKFEQVVAKDIPSSSQEPQIEIDAEIYLSDITPKFNRILKQMGPFGPQNMKPVFMARGLRDNGYARKIGENQDHLKLNIISGTDQKTYNAIGFRLSEKYEMVTSGTPFKAAFTVEENHWNGITSIQLNIKDIKPDD